ncbi:MAG: hypothetical protein AAF632_12805 [Bacteroidota bacterium]
MTSFSLTTQELNYLADTDFLLAKVAIQQKANQLLATTQLQLKEYITNQVPAFPEVVLTEGGKISRGENYQQLPYYVLDYPRLLSQNDVFNLRTMIWWGHELSISWHLAGHSLSHFRSRLESQWAAVKRLDWHVCVGDDPWQYHRHPSYYRLASELSFEKTTWAKWLESRGFCKFAVFFPLSGWDGFPTQAVTFLDQIVTLLDL